MRTNATQTELDNAMEIVNRKYNNNIIFNNLSYTGRQINFTLKVKDSHGKGARLGFPHTSWETRTGKPYKQRHLINACWHVHGDLFDALFSINDNIFIWSGGKKICSSFGNWEDRNIGSQYQPFYYSEACECKE